MNDQVKKKKMMLIEKLVRCLNRRKNLTAQAFPCESDISYFDDEDEQKNIADAKRKLAKLKKDELSALLKDVRSSFSCFDNSWSDVDIFFIFILYSVVYSDMSFDSNDVIPFLLNKSEQLVDFNLSLEEKNLSRWCYREEYYGRGLFKYFFHSVTLAERKLFGE